MTQEKLDILRHSVSHVMAHAVKKLFPDVKLGIGPAIEEGFYYDFDTENAFSDETIIDIENAMNDIIAKDYAFERIEMTKKEALKLFSSKGELYKCELINELESVTVSIYKSGDFEDLCKGPHVARTGTVKVFKLLSVAGAYWRGNEKNKMLKRIYGTAFFSQKELKEYLFRLHEAKKRDHRILGKALDLFSFHNEAPASPFFHPKGIVVYNEIIKYWREEHERENYVEVKTPIILRDELWKQSGHYEHYKEHMYFTEIDGGQYAVKPMNCPGGLFIYKSRRHSYREFPIKMAELGLVHRHELSGVLHGLFRVKSFTIDDAHIFCLEDMITKEVSQAIKLILKLYSTFNFHSVTMELSTRPEKSMGSDEVWEKATDGLKDALDKNGITYKINEGDGAFYGPKIDFHIKDSLERSWQCGTIQVDFSMPERFKLDYIGADGAFHRPVMIHRAAFGSLERFLGILIEHYGGAFPLWLSPVQVRVMSISEKYEDYARKIYSTLKENNIRCDIDVRSEKIGYKIREAESLKINYMIIIGENEVTENKIAVRGRGRKDLGALSLDEFIHTACEEIKNRK
ncbi:MAG: threonine--tRNA ligase [Candidatus Omnitrophica bacterium]|nr:threonine--tRNA ligase [Candidatus Omnitrophota bacterium]